MSTPTAAPSSAKPVVDLDYFFNSLDCENTSDQKAMKSQVLRQYYRHCLKFKKLAKKSTVKAILRDASLTSQLDDWLSSRFRELGVSPYDPNDESQVKAAQELLASSVHPIDWTKELFIHVDGGCKPNPGKGGFGITFIQENKILEGNDLFHFEEESTNNQMELSAFIAALSIIEAKHISGACHIFTDSNLVKQGVNDWLPNWKKNSFRTASGSPVKNKELWLKVDSLLSSGKLLNMRRAGLLTVNHEKGHAGGLGNTRADFLAGKAIKEKSSNVSAEYLP